MNAYVIRKTTGAVVKIVLSEELDGQIDMGKEPGTAYSATYDLETPENLATLLRELTEQKVRIEMQ